MQAISEIGESTQRMTYRVADQSLVVETQEEWASEAIEQLFAGWYLSRETQQGETPRAPAIVIRNGDERPDIPTDWPKFEVAGGGVCFSSGEKSYIEINGSIIEIGKAHEAVRVWTNGVLDINSQTLTRLVTYALAAALRRGGLFELHSGAVIEPKSGKGVLIIGPSGSGKSTLTVQLAAAGWPFLTDDVLFLSAAGETVKAWAARRCFAITSETFAASTFLQSQASLEFMRVQQDEKQQFAPRGVFQSEFREQCVPKTLFFSELSGGERTNVLPLSAAETMTRLIRMNPWSCYDRITASDHLAMLSALVKQARGYSLQAGKDILESETASNLVARHTGD